MPSVVVKWDQGRQTRFSAHPEDEIFMRRFVMKDFIVYTLIYLFPPCSVFINKFADYPLTFTKNVWLILNTIVSVSAFLTVVVPMLLPSPSYVTPFERRGAMFAFLLRCVLTSCVEALNIESESIKSLHLERFPIILAEPTDQELTAKHFYESIMSLSSFTTEINAATLFKRKIGILAGFVISLGLVSIPMLLRRVHHIGYLGNSKAEMFCILLSATVIFGVSFLLINVFFIGFALYRSMRSSMRRLKNGTLGAWASYKHQKKLKKLENEETTKKSKATKGNKNFPTLKLDVTNPKNLRAWLNVHEALNRRKQDVAARLLELGATLGMMFFLLMILLIVLETFSTDYDNMSSKEIIDDITSLDNSSLYVFTYLVLVLGACMGVLSLVGNEYNHSAKQLQIHHLYSIQLEATLDYYSGNVNLSEEETSKLKDSIRLLESVQQHLNNHVKDLGILGISYSKLFWGISGIVSSVATRQLFHMF